ncbi:unnamed protein product [Haemonchus placei]|uniref:Transposase n=1 Tax=Haemonchus placei TaxID=6290 RepID=A0A0N4WBG8_HAEPC|nr:unnamed protein product [Haemonchus placei]
MYNAHWTPYINRSFSFHNTSLNSVCSSVIIALINNHTYIKVVLKTFAVDQCLMSSTRCWVDEAFAFKQGCTTTGEKRIDIVKRQRDSRTEQEEALDILWAIFCSIQSCMATSTACNHHPLISV